MKNVPAIIAGVRRAVKGKNVHWHAGMNAFQMLVGTVLSQRTKDANTEKAARQLFAKYRTAEQIANAPIAEIRKLIRQSGFYRVKAKHIQKLCKVIIEKYKSKVPQNREELMALPGVGYKTADITLSYGFGIPTIAIDTHCNRVSKRIGLVNEKADVEEVRKTLEKLTPKRFWLEINELLVIFGQNICTPIKPKCFECPITKYCNYYQSLVKPNLNNIVKLRKYVRLSYVKNQK